MPLGQGTKIRIYMDFHEWLLDGVMFSFRCSVVLSAFEMSGKLRNNMLFLVMW